MSLADNFKAAASDALKKAASLLGVGLELYGDQPAQEPERPKTLPTLPLEERLTSRQLAATRAVAPGQAAARADRGGQVDRQRRRA